MRKIDRLIWLLVFLLGMGPAMALPPLSDDGWEVEPVRDINASVGAIPWSGLTSYSNGFSAHGLYYFVANHAATGSELWFTDGTPEGTVATQEITTGFRSTNPRRFAEMGGALYFLGTKDNSAGQLFVIRSPGAAPELVKNLVGDNSTSNFDNLVAANDRLYLFVSPDASESELWTSDGTSAGTIKVRSFTHETRSSATNAMERPVQTFYLTSFVAVGDEVFFGWSRIFGETELWRSDGTPEGTSIINSNLDLSETYVPEATVAVGERVYFVTWSDREMVYSLWSNDTHTTGTEKVACLDTPESPATYAPELIPANDLLYVIVPSESGRRLHIVDSRGYRPVSGVPSEAGLVFSRTVVDGNNLYFAGDTVNPAVWFYNPVSEETIRLPLGSMTSEEPIRQMDLLDRRWIYIITGYPYPNRIHKLDVLSGESTLAYSAVDAGLTSATFSGISGSDYYFLTYPASNATVLWRSDSETGELVQVFWNDTGTLDAYPQSLIPFNDSIYFTASAGVSGNGIWSSGGTAQSTEVVWTPTEPDISQNRPTLATYRDRLYFTMHGAFQNRIYSSRGEPNDAVEITPIPVGEDWNYIALLGGLDEWFYFARRDQDVMRMWKTNGLDVMEVPFSGGTRDSGISIYPSPVEVYRGELYFFLRVSEGLELWKINRNATDVNRVAKLAYPYYHAPYSMAIVADRLYYTIFGGSACAFCPTEESLLGITDGTESGSHIMEGVAAFGPGDPLFSIGDHYFLSADFPSVGTELLVGDNVTTGSLLLADLRPGSESSSPAGFVRLGDDVLFSTQVSDSQNALWRMDGSLTTPTEVSRFSYLDLNATNHLVNTGPAVVFAADDGVRGTELWKTDGRNTELLAQVVMGSAGAYIPPPVVAGEYLYFSASNDDGVAPETGRELYAIPLSIVNDMNPPVVGIIDVPTRPVSILEEISLRIIISENSSPLEVDEIESTNAEVLRLRRDDEGVYTLTIQPVTQGPVFVQVAARAVRDYGANWNAASNIVEFPAIDPARKRDLGWVAY